MVEYYLIERLENELQCLYKKLEAVRDDTEKERIQETIQERNLKLVRLMPNE